MEHKHYEAFISYRHVSHDKAIAERLQILLEKYRPPRKGVYTNTKRIKRIFRDESELHSVGNLSAGIKEALRNSDFLIVVCSEETKKSEWCLEEIDYFKELHNGKTDRILALLADGDPNRTFPELLCFETKTTVLEGETVSRRVEITPLAANVTAESTKASLKKLSTEFLRIAAPILGCSYDDLFRRHQRRFVRNLTSAAAAVVAAVILSVSYVLANNIELEKRNSLLSEQIQKTEEARSRADEQAEIAKENEARAIVGEAEAKRQAGIAQTNEEIAKENEARALLNEEEAKRQEQIARDNEEEANRQSEIARDNERDARSKLSDLLTVKGIETIKTKDNNSALAYFAKALENNPENITAANTITGLLRYNAWPMLTHSVPGDIVDDVILVRKKDAAELGDIENVFILPEHVTMSSVRAISGSRDYILVRTGIMDSKGEYVMDFRKSIDFWETAYTEYSCVDNHFVIRDEADLTHYLIINADSLEKTDIYLNMTANPDRTVESDTEGLYVNKANRKTKTRPKFRFYNGGMLSVYSTYVTNYSKAGERYIPVETIDLCEVWKDDDSYRPSGEADIYVKDNMAIVADDNRFYFMNLLSGRITWEKVIPRFVSDNKDSVKIRAVDISNSGLICVSAGIMGTRGSTIKEEIGYTPGMGYMQIYDALGTEQPMDVAETDFNVMKVRFNKDGTLLLYGGEDKNLHIMPTSKYDQSSVAYMPITLAFPFDADRDAFCMTEGDGSFAAVKLRTEENVKIYSLSLPKQGGKVLYTINHRIVDILETDHSFVVSGQAEIVMLDKRTFRPLNTVDWREAVGTRKAFTNKLYYNENEQLLLVWISIIDEDGKSNDAIVTFDRNLRFLNLVRLEDAGLDAQPVLSVDDVQVLENLILVNRNYNKPCEIFDFQLNLISTIKGETDTMAYEKFLLIDESRCVSFADRRVLLRDIKTGFVYDELEISSGRNIADITVSESRDRLCIAYRDNSDVRGGLITVDIDVGQRFLKADMVDTVLKDAPMKFFEDFYGNRTVLSCYNSIMLLNSKDLQMKSQTDVAFNGTDIQIAVDRDERYIAVSQMRNDTTVFDVYDKAINDVLYNFFESAQFDGKYQKSVIKGLSFSADDKLYYGVIRELKMIDLSGQTFNRPTLAAISALSGKEVDEASYRTSNRTDFDAESALIYTSDDWANKFDAYISEYDIGGTSQKVEIFMHKLKYGLLTQEREVREAFETLEKEVWDSGTLNDINMLYLFYSNYYKNTGEYGDIIARWADAVSKFCENKADEMMGYDEMITLFMQGRLFRDFVLRETAVDDAQVVAALKSISDFVERDAFSSSLVQNDVFDDLFTLWFVMNETLYIAPFLENNDREIQKTASLSQSQFLPQQVYRALYNDDIDAAVRKYKEYCNKLEVIGFDEYAPSVISWIRIFEARGVLESETVDRFMNAI